MSIENEVQRGLQFRTHQEPATVCKNAQHSIAPTRKAGVIRIGENQRYSRGLQIPQNDNRVEEQSRHNDELTLTLELEANVLKCHRETASVFVVCLENRLLRTLDSVRQNAPAVALDYHGVLWKEMPSGFVLQSVSGHLLAITFVVIEDDR